MPQVGSWNGKFTGEKNFYAKSFPDNKIPKDIINKNFSYDFGDGWCANVEVKRVDNIQGRKMMKKSNGFLNYDWMINSIIKNKKIKIV